jgi:hypothetical protein
MSAHQIWTYTLGSASECFYPYREAAGRSKLWFGFFVLFLSSLCTSIVACFWLYRWVYEPLPDDTNHGGPPFPGKIQFVAKG